MEVYFSLAFGFHSESPKQTALLQALIQRHMPFHLWFHHFQHTASEGTRLLCVKPEGEGERQMAQERFLRSRLGSDTHHIRHILLARAQPWDHA